MHTGTYLKLLLPKENAFIHLFKENAYNLLSAAIILRDLMNYNSSEEVDKYYREIKAIEHAGDEITRKTYEQLNKSFITPFDRDDIHELTANVDDVVDLIEVISRRIFQYKPYKILPVYREMAELIVDAANEIYSSIHLLKEPALNKKKIMESCNKVKLIEHRADNIFYSGASELFSAENDPKELIKMSKILENLERCIDEEEKVTSTLKTIIIKVV